jgi:hypothetical protein
MTHFEAVERSRRLLDGRPDCGHPLRDLGPDPHNPTLRVWACIACNAVLYIDPIGVIRDTGSSAELADGSETWK